MNIMIDLLNKISMLNIKIIINTYYFETMYKSIKSKINIQ